MQKFPIMDIYLASFLLLHGIQPELTAQGNKIVFQFPVSNKVYKLCSQYNSNQSIPILDFVSVLRRLKSQMINMKGELK